MSETSDAPEALRLRKRNWLVAPIATHNEVRDMVRAWHYSRSVPNTSTYRHGLFRSEYAPLAGVCFGAALWIPPTRTAAESVVGEDWRGVLCLSRLVVAPEVPPNGASFLLGRSMKMIDKRRWTVLLTYADTAHGHTGAIYRATNWEELGATPAGDVWVNEYGEQCGRKRGQRTLTVRDMTARGLARLPSLPKIKCVYRFGPGGGRDAPLPDEPGTQRATEGDE